MKRHIIYIPGLGDGYDPIRRLGLRLWRRPSILVTHVPMRWSDPTESYEQKLARVRAAIESKPGHQTILVGESAGGAVVIGAMHQFSASVDRVVTVCGMNQGEANVNPRLYQKNRAFRGAMQAADRAVRSLNDTDRAKIVTIYSSGDFTVRPKDTLLPGVRSYDLRIAGHMYAILAVLFLRHSLVLKD